MKESGNAEKIEPQKEKTPRKISRREFLTTSLTMGAFLAELAIPQKARAELEKLLATQEFIQENFEDTIARLKRLVYEKKEEVYYAHVKKGAREGALNIAAESDEKSVTSIELLELYNDPALAEIKFIHTHPANVYRKIEFLPKDHAEKMIEKRGSLFPLVPSDGDLWECLIQRLRAEERKSTRYVKSFVVEPSGIWEYDVDPRHSGMKKLITQHPASDEYMPSILGLKSLGDQLFAWQKKFYEAGGATPELINEFTVWAKKEWGVTLKYQPFQ